MSSPEIRPLGPADDLEAELDLRRRAFGPVAADERPGWLEGVRHSVEAGEMFGAFDRSRLVASARYFTMRQWWHGRAMPMAGVAGVKVAPEERGRGVGRALMTTLLQEIAARGFPVSALYPATAPLYRSLGWEIAGGKYETVLPARSLAALVPPDCPAPAPDSGGGGRGGGGEPLRRATPADAVAVVDVLGAVYQSQRDCGPATHEPGVVAAWLDDDDRFAYLAGDGFLTYHWADEATVVHVDLLAAASAATARAFWQILASHATIAGTVRACLSPADPVSWLTREPVAVTRQDDPWMLRVADVPAAVAARGFPAAAALTAQLELTDEILSGNSGHWSLEIGGGAGKLAPSGSGAGGSWGGGPGAGGSWGGGRGAGGSSAGGSSAGGGLRLGPRGFAALFAGVPLATLRRAGLASGGDPDTDDALDAAFGGGPAFMLHGF